jgi:hypothetical protein
MAFARSARPVQGSLTMKMIQTILGTFMAILGCIWIAQGLNFLPAAS